MPLQPHFFLKEEINRILLAVQDNSEVYIFCKFLWRTGVRLSEALEVTPEDINQEKGLVYIRTGKRRTDKNIVRIIPLQQDLLADLKKYIRSRSISLKQPIFPFTSRTALNYVKAACNKAELKDQRSHPSSFRHSYALHCLMNGVPVNQVNDLLGNRDIKKTMKYLFVIPQGNNLQSVAW